MRASFKKTAASAAVLVVLASLTGLLANQMSARGIPLNPPPAEPGEMLPFEVVWEAHDEGTAVFIDARTREEYEAGHIAGALNVPYLEREEHLERLAREIPKDQWVIIYCDGVDCEASLKLSAWMTHKGWQRADIFEEGYPAWSDSGLAVSEGSQP